VAGSEQFGETSGNWPQIALTMRMNADGETQDSTTYLIFSPDAAPYSFARLRALGWTGKDIESIAKDGVPGIDKNEVDVKIWSDTYQGKPQTKCEIMTGGTPTLAKPTDKGVFAKRVAEIMGQSTAVAKGKVEAPF